MEPDDILDTSVLNFSGDFNEQVLEVMEYVRLKKDQVLQLNLIFRDLHYTLGAVWGDIYIMGFGSIVTGLGIKTSDVDCYVALPSWMYPPEKSFVLKAKSILMRHPHIFQHAFAITTAKVPIVQFYHAPTGMYCDISFNSSAGVENSRLIANLLQDKKALQLAILIKYWSKIHNLTGTGLIPNYCLTLLVIFFLQQSDIIEAVADLQRNVHENYIDDWNTAFHRRNSTDSSNKSLYQLLGEFFKYYKTFDYKTYIISPYLGRPIRRELFAKVETVPLDFSLYKTNVATKSFKPFRLDAQMCVQDPFEHNRNCAVAVYPKLTQKFLAQLQIAVSIYENNDEKDFLKELLRRAPENSPTVSKKPKPKPKVFNHGVTKPHKRNHNYKNFKRFRFRQNHFR